MLQQCAAWLRTLRLRVALPAQVAYNYLWDASGRGSLGAGAAFLPTGSSGPNRAHC